MSTAYHRHGAGPRLARLVTGGQAGVDRAVLDAALEAGFPVGGWCPRGRRAEDGPIHPRYPLCETPSPRYAQRTWWNVRAAEATLILAATPLSGGTALTLHAAHRLRRPVRCVDPEAPGEPAATLAWLAETGTTCLNVAGPRASAEPRIYARARRWMEAFLEGLRLSGRGAAAP